MEVPLYDSAVCRLCAEDNGNGEYLYTADGEDSDLSSMVNRYLPLKVLDNRIYNKHIRQQLDFLVLQYGASTDFRCTIFHYTNQDLKFTIFQIFDFDPNFI